MWDRAASIVASPLSSSLELKPWAYGSTYVEASRTSASLSSAPSLGMIADVAAVITLKNFCD